MQLRIQMYQLIPHWTEFEDSGEEYRFWAFVLGLSFPGYHIGLNTLITSLIGTNSIDTMLAYVILLGSIFMAIVKTPKTQWKEYFQIPVVIIVSCILILTVSMWLFPENSIILKRILTTYLQTSCWGILVANFIDRVDLYKKSFKLIGYIVFWFLVYEPFSPRSTLFVDVANSWGTSGYLTWGYRMLIAVILLLYTSINSKRIIDWIFALVATLELIMIGNRGSLVAITVFIMLYIIFCTETLKKIKYMISTTCMGVLIYEVIQPDNLLRLEMQMDQLGIKSRNLSKILNSTLTESGREVIYDLALKYIKSGNWFGLGIGGDQRLVGIYPHNILLELMLQYGNILGCLIFVFLVLSIIYILFKNKNKQYRAIIIVFFSLSMVKLWFSSTYWYELWFWGFLMIIIKSEKYSEYYNSYIEFNVENVV